MNHGNNEILLEYQYKLLEKKYAKKEVKKGLKLIAVKITNYSEKELTFGKDLKLTYKNGDELKYIENESVFKSIKQSSWIYLLHLSSTWVRISNTKISQNSFETKSIPIGLIVGPWLPSRNVIRSIMANKQFKTKLLEYNTSNTIIKKV